MNNIDSIEKNMQLNTDLLRPYTDGWSNSEPIFDLELNDSGDRVMPNLWDPIFKYKPLPVPLDIISELACANFAEHFHVEKKSFQTNITNVHSIMFIHMKLDIINVLEHYMATKKPHSTKLYKWLDWYYLGNVPNEVMRGIMMLYRYNAVVDGNTQNKYKHKQNIILILDAMRRKYENK